jgi:hypothetical protein
VRDKSESLSTVAENLALLAIENTITFDEACTMLAGTIKLMVVCRDFISIKRAGEALKIALTRLMVTYKALGGMIGPDGGINAARYFSPHEALEEIGQVMYPNTDGIKAGVLNRQVFIIGINAIEPGKWLLGITHGNPYAPLAWVDKEDYIAFFSPNKPRSPQIAKDELDYLFGINDDGKSC